MVRKIMQVKVEMSEIERILNLKADLDYSGTLQDYIVRYLKLGWPLVAIDGKTGDDLGLDFTEGKKWETSLGGPGVAKINLGVHTGSLSGLLVLEVTMEEQKSSLDELGEWRSHCVAELSTGLEKHFYMLPPDFQHLALSGSTSKVYVATDGFITLLPPSLDPLAKECWRWRNAPWDSPPASLPLPMVNYLHAMRVPGAPIFDLERKPKICWRELYCTISPFDTVLQAFAQPTTGNYYEKLLQAALEVGLADSEILFSLLWHAPLGDAKERPERWADLQKQVTLALTEAAPQSPKLHKGFRPPGSPGTP